MRWNEMWFWRILRGRFILIGSDGGMSWNGEGDYLYVQGKDETNSTWKYKICKYSIL